MVTVRVIYFVAVGISMNGMAAKSYQSTSFLAVSILTIIIQHALFLIANAFTTTSTTSRINIQTITNYDPIDEIHIPLVSQPCHVGDGIKSLLELVLMWSYKGFLSLTALHLAVGDQPITSKERMQQNDWSVIII